MDVIVKVFDGYHWDSRNKKIAEVRYDNIRGYKVVRVDKATEIELGIDETCRDRWHKYLIITLENGKTVIYSDSHAYMIRVGSAKGGESR